MCIGAGGVRTDMGAMIDISVERASRLGEVQLHVLDETSSAS